MSTILIWLTVFLESYLCCNQTFIIRPGLSPAWKAFGNMCVAKGLSPSPARENAEPNLQDSTNKGRHRPSKHHKIRKAGNITEATRR